MSGDIALFSYGTLRDPAVQRALFGRALVGEADALAGFALGEVAIPDPEAVATSGLAVHLILRRADGPVPDIAGERLVVTPEELAAADAYEGETYARIAVTLRSGRAAFVYVAPGAG
ncbi:gamma-glutamylcyclotransferase [Sphingomonas naphthae]|uniref:Gamma-glutamylcyclotransferase n=1 Tax=Sphingomonas naphthae TaxID=1813468 RepID=A0ABY7TLL2_9SPHN|nr:gamma-glutamylcyclotransferase family protein [Sphingomonas naphthae]WCT73661.1 gamma-glutamylcyclotransferase [Sphingomonas naphthae]